MIYPLLTAHFTDMSVVLRTGLSFFNIDSSYDFLFSIGMEPFVELSFTPTLFKTGNGTIMNYRANISPPNVTQWSNLMVQFAQHLIDRYGADVVQKLIFEVWNEYNCGFLDSPTPRETYFEIYSATALALKSVNKKLMVGGPTTCMGADIELFIQFCRDHNLPLDFVSTHVYPTDPNVTDGNFELLVNSTYTTVESSPAAGTPVFFSEFNDGLFGDPPLHDFPYAASFFVRHMARLDAALPPSAVPLLSWWTFSDVFEEAGMPAEEFDKPSNTGWGLLSASGIPKPIYRAFQLLHQAGTERHRVTSRNAPHPDSDVLVRGAKKKKKKKNVCKFLNKAQRLLAMRMAT